MPLPLVKCPTCHSVMSLDVLLSDDAPRDALAAIVDVHPAGKTFVLPLLRYIGLFAPEKSQLTHRRMAALISELAPAIHERQIKRDGRVWGCPLDYWSAAFETVLAQRDSGQLRLPLKSHGYLFEVLVAMVNRAESRAETKKEAQRAGHAGLGTTAERQKAVTVEETQKKAQMPDSVWKALKKQH